MRTPERFLEARPSAWVIRAFRFVLPLLLRAIGIRSVSYQTNELLRYRALASDRVLLVPNHPTNTDPAVLFHLGGAAGVSMFFLACREAFDSWFGAWGWCMRRLGAYSIIRGTTDRASFKATKDLLGTPSTHVVVFPEGEVYSQNDSLLPFHEGPFQMAFWALEEISRQDDSATIHIQPVVLKYFLTGTVDAEIHASLVRLERHVSSPLGASNTPGERVHAVGWSMLRSLEREYRIPHPAEDHWADSYEHRLEAIKEAVLDRVRESLGLPKIPGTNLPERMRALIHAIEVVVQDEPSDVSPYESRLHRFQRERARPLLRDLDRLATFIAIHDGYVSEHPTQERLCETLVRLERECFGRVRIRRRFDVRVALPESYDLRGRLGYYRADRTRCLAELVRALETDMLATLRLMDRG